LFVNCFVNTSFSFESDSKNSNVSAQGESIIVHLLTGKINFNLARFEYLSFYVNVKVHKTEIIKNYTYEFA
jgi:hypothetical protein